MLTGIKAVIVDLDGTMVDTLGDFEEALNRTLADLDLPPVTRALIERTVGKGSEHLIRSVLAHQLALPEVTGLSNVCQARSVDTLVSVAPGGEATDKAVNAQVLAALGPDGVFVNIGRGSTVDEEALAAALADGTILAAGLDVFAREPQVPEALLKVDNAILLPHVGSASLHTRRAMADLTVDNLVAWFDTGKPLTPVPETRHVVSSRDRGAAGAR